MCSGDFLAEGASTAGYTIQMGFFLHIVIAIVLLVFALSLLAMVVGGVCVCLTGKNPFKRSEEF